jgi:hypothetical protein
MTPISGATDMTQEHANEAEFIAGTPVTYETDSHGLITATYSRHSRKWPLTGQLVIRKGKSKRGALLGEFPMPEYEASNFYRAAILELDA